MKVILATLLASALSSAAPAGYGPHQGHGYGLEGHSSFGHGGHGGFGGFGVHDYSVPANYAFGYGVKDDYHGTNFGHSETRDGYRTQGQYYVHLPDGRIQKVSYYADEHGYHPTITYEGVAHYPQHHGGYGGDFTNTHHGTLSPIQNFVSPQHGLSSHRDSYVPPQHGITSHIDSYVPPQHGLSSHIDSYVPPQHGITSHVDSYVAPQHGISSQIGSFISPHRGGYRTNRHTSGGFQDSSNVVYH